MHNRWEAQQPAIRSILAGMSSGISVDEFQALEQKVLRAVEIVKREREARSAAEAEIASLRQQLAAQAEAAQTAQSQISSAQSQADAVQGQIQAAQSQVQAAQREKAATEGQIAALIQERDAVRQRVERMLHQMDELL